MYALIGLLFILAGMFLMFTARDKAKTTNESKTEEESKTDASAANPEEDEEKKRKTAERKQSRSKLLTDLTPPGNLPPVRIYFGSQTGTAEGFANDLDEEAAKIGVPDSKVIGFGDFNEEEFVTHKLLIVCVATHYEGDPCDNTRNFHKWIKKLLKKADTEKPFTGMQYSVFGLADSSYE